MRILICDDNPLIVEQLHNLLRLFFKRSKLALPEIATYSSGDALLKDTGDKDIVFLDIEMPGVDGIYVGNSLKRDNKHVIIISVTSFAEYLDEAMRFHVFRYLSKPIDEERFFRNLKDALQMLNSSDGKIAIETKNDVHTIYTTDIVCIEAQMRKVIVHTTHQDFYSIHNMQYWADTLPKASFVQTHRSFIVNMAHITNFDNNTIHLYNNQFTAYLTRRKYVEFKANYLFYLESTR